MPLADAGFTDKDSGRPDSGLLLTYGPTLRVTVSQFHQVTETGNTVSQVVAALVDTGASESCIDNELAEELGLPVIDKMDMSGVSGMQKHNVYLASVHIPELEFAQYGRFAGVDLRDGGQVHQALLGRTFLQNVILIYDGLRAQVTLASQRLTK